MFIYTASPRREVPVTEDNPLFRVDVDAKVCATWPYKFIVLGENKWANLIALDLSDEEFDALVETLAAARFTRMQQKQEAYEALAAEFAPKPEEWDNERIDDAREYDEVQRMEAGDDE